MKIVIFYFSGTGNTKWVAERFSALLMDKDHDASLFSIEELSVGIHLPDIIEGADFIGFASPIYGANLPKIMRDFIHRFSSELGYDEASPRKLIFLNTYAYVNGFGYFATRNTFKEMNVSIKGYVNFKLFNSIPFERWKSRKIKIENVNLRMKKTLNKLNILIDRIENNKRYINGISLRLLIGKVVRQVLKPKIENSYYLMKVNETKCNRCMICVMNCPTKSIKYENRQFEFLPTCTACMRCYNYCPTKAITVGSIGAKEHSSRYKGIESLQGSLPSSE